MTKRHWSQGHEGSVPGSCSVRFLISLPVKCDALLVGTRDGPIVIVVAGRIEVTAHSIDELRGIGPSSQCSVRLGGAITSSVQTLVAG
jgi:hypothetical protein